MLQQVCNHFPDVYPHAFNMYGHVSSLVYTKGHSTVILQSQEGVHQGDPLGPSLFSITIQPLLSKVQKQHPRVQTLAYLDDVFLIGSPEETVNAFQDLQCQFESTGLLVSKQKCEAYAMAYPDEWSVDIAINTSGIDILGTPIGTPDYVSARCTDKAKSGTELCSKLLELDDPQSSLLLLRHCHVPSLNHSSRTVIPEQLNKAALIHDDQTYQTFSSVMGLEMYQTLIHGFRVVCLLGMEGLVSPGCNQSLPWHS
ncbi:uncharacterized protein LOC134193028 [Corticium candelabrum]|uniref:uncharacterized protein LOC134193028 n=1 Tax=Corticium candelabrum TaxID=121492 RepID=UPI002E259A13|nr:uncharacterized protein LOC134193028 [Corticium candelabrum]